jgi:DnaJ like chaperone protein
MSLWSRISDALAALAKGEGLAAVFDRLRAPPERSVAFTIAVIALGAKMAKADGHVTRNEVAAFREVFAIPSGEEAAAARVFNLARQDVAGFDVYARKIAGMFPPGDAVLMDLLEGLFHITVADGDFDPREEAFLFEVATLFSLQGRCFRVLKSRFVPDSPPDPYEVLGVRADATMPEIRSAWARAVRETHPDRMIARGLPAEAVRMAEGRLRAINLAWEEINRDRAA